MRIYGSGNALFTVFPLVKINSRLDGYFIDAGGAIFSTKKGPAQRLIGSQTKSWYPRTYTLSNMNYIGHQLLSASKSHRDWAKEIQLESAPIVDTSGSVNQAAVSPRSHAKSVHEGITGRGVVIAQVSKHDDIEHLEFGSKPAIHMSENSWNSELQRLAFAKPGTKFVALKIVGGLVAGGVTKL